MKDKINKLLIDGKYERAFDLIPESDDLTLLKARFKRNKSDNMRGIISRNDFEMENNRILYAVLDLINDIDFPTTQKVSQKASEQTPNSEGKKVFLSYSHKDEPFKEGLEAHLAPLRKSGKITTWSDRSIMPGDVWDERILNELHAADIILLLVSADFMNSNYIWDKELPIAFQRQEEGKCTLIPVIVRPCLWQETALAKFQALPKNGSPVASYVDKDQAYLEIVSGIKAIIG